mmetsp:Transcript_110677/g.343149  ORF Transcript_110677/g.343149 Transcript_110677/m.343149 type:complete len:492 (+) Transcript_110677:818-2293(+)
MGQQVRRPCRVREGRAVRPTVAAAWEHVRVLQELAQGLVVLGRVQDVGLPEHPAQHDVEGHLQRLQPSALRNGLNTLLDAGLVAGRPLPDVVPGREEAVDLLQERLLLPGCRREELLALADDLVAVLRHLQALEEPLFARLQELLEGGGHHEGVQRPAKVHEEALRPHEALRSRPAAGLDDALDGAAVQGPYGRRRRVVSKAGGPGQPDLLAMLLCQVKHPTHLRLHLLHHLGGVHLGRRQVVVAHEVGRHLEDPAAALRHRPGQGQHLLPLGQRAGDERAALVAVQHQAGGREAQGARRDAVPHDLGHGLDLPLLNGVLLGTAGSVGEVRAVPEDPGAHGGVADHQRNVAGVLPAPEGVHVLLKRLPVPHHALRNGTTGYVLNGLNQVCEEVTAILLAGSKADATIAEDRRSHPVTGARRQIRVPRRLSIEMSMAVYPAGSYDKATRVELALALQCQVWAYSSDLVADHCHITDEGWLASPINNACAADD